MTTYSITIPDSARLGCIHRFSNPPRWSVAIHPTDYGAGFVTGVGYDEDLTAAAAKAVAHLEANLENLRKVHKPAPKLNLDFDLDL